MKPSVLTTFDRLTEWFLQGASQLDPGRFRQAKRLVIFDYVLLACAVGYWAAYAAFGCPSSAWIALSTAISVSLSLVLVKRNWPPVVCGNVVTAGGWLTLTWLAFLNGGITGPSLVWYSVLPVVAVLTASALSGAIWTAVCTLCLAGFASSEYLGLLFHQELSAAGLELFRSVALVGLVVYHFIMACVRIRIENRALAALEAAHVELHEMRDKFSRLENSRGYSAEELWKLERERTALLQFIRFKYREFDRDFTPMEDPADQDSVDLGANTNQDDPLSVGTELSEIAISTILAGATKGASLPAINA